MDYKLINGNVVFSNEALSIIYPHLVKSKINYCNDLFDRGYWFLSNNSHAMDLQTRWRNFSIIRVARTTFKKPGVLWAIKEQGK